MGLQMMSQAKLLATLGAAEWFITSVDSFMSLQIAQLCKFSVTLGAGIWFFTCMYSQMFFQVTLTQKSLATLVTLKSFPLNNLRHFACQSYQCIRLY